MEINVEKHDRTIIRNRSLIGNRFFQQLCFMSVGNWMYCGNNHQSIYVSDNEPFWRFFILVHMYMYLYGYIYVYVWVYFWSDHRIEFLDFAMFDGALPLLLLQTPNQKKKKKFRSSSAIWSVMILSLRD